MLESSGMYRLVLITMLFATGSSATQVPPPGARTYLSQESVRQVLGDPAGSGQIAPWLKTALGSAQIVSLVPFVQGEGIASEHYKLTLDNGTSYFIKVEASKRRIGTQGIADSQFRKMGLLKPVDGVEFVAQLASTIVKLSEDRSNEIIVFPLIEGQRFDRVIEKGEDKPNQWARLGRALARIKTRSMEYNGTYQDFLNGRGLIHAVWLPDFHEANIMLGSNGTLYLLDYQLLRFSNENDIMADADVEKILLEASQTNANTLLIAYCLQFPIGISVGNYCKAED